MEFGPDYLQKLAGIKLPTVFSDYNGEKEQELLDYFNMSTFASELIKVSEGISDIKKQEDVEFLEGELSKLVEKLNLEEL